MATSLAEQLQKLRTPQTGLLLQDKKRASLLFDPREAANLDREIVLNIGRSGLQDLIKLCEAFREFENTLFAPSSLSLERSVHDANINKRLDNGIEKFLILLSPYFLLNTAHKALEWLVHRFHIHQFNKKHFLMLILPYHETRMFVRALQLVDLTDQRGMWLWLKPLQKPGVPLPSLTLINHVAGDNGFLKLLCDHVLRATAIYSDRANCLSTLYAFYTMAVVGAIDRSPSLTEIQINHVLPTLLKGLGSTISDFAASSYMILAKLSTKAKLTEETMDHLVMKALKRPELKNEAMLLIFFLYETAHNRMTTVPEKLVRRVAKLPWFVDQTIKIKNLGVKVGKFMVPMLETAFEVILKKPMETEDSIVFMINDIFTRITFDDADVDAILKNTLKPRNIIGDVSEQSKIFIAELYGTLERGYPVRFDDYLKKLMKSNDSESRKIMQFLMSWHTGARHAKDSLDILYKLNHFRPAQRIAALEKIGRGEVDITEGFRDVVNKALVARFNDDNVRVVRTLLELPIDRLKILFANDTLVDELMILLAHSHTGERAKLAELAIKLLLEVCEDGDDTTVFIATLPYLFPGNENEVGIAMQILQSDFAKKNRYMLMVKEDMGNSRDPQSIGDAAFHNILKSELLPPTGNILTTMKLQSCKGDAASLFFNFLLLGSVCRVPVGSLANNVAREVIEMAAEMIKQYPNIKQLPDCNQLTGEKIREALTLTRKEILPLQAATYVIEMVHRRLDIKINSRIDFEDDPERAFLVFRILEILLNGMNSDNDRSHYSWCLKIFFQRHFASSRDMLCFLSQFFNKPVNPQTSLHCLKISLDLIDHSNSVQWIFQDKTFTTNLLVCLARENDKCREAAVDILKKLSQTFNLAMDGFSGLLMELASKTTELAMDHEQLSFILYQLLSPDPDVRHHIANKTVSAKLQKARDLLFDTIVEGSMPIHSIAQLLDVLTHVNGPSILENLASFAIELHVKLHENNSCSSGGKKSKKFTADCLKNILQRFNSTTVEALGNAKVWKLFEIVTGDHKLGIAIDETSILSPSAIVIKQIDDVFFEKVGNVSSELQRKIVAKLVDIVTDCEIGSIVAVSNRAVRRIKIDARLVVDELKHMRQSSTTVEGITSRITTNARSSRRSSNKLHVQPQSEVINSRRWKRGITLLEFVQRASNIENEEILIPVLFDLLRMCLGFEEQNPLEYTNQLLLSTIYHLATKGLPIPDAHLQIDVISQCIRISHNPQTHHHALLVLVELFKIANVETALHNIMPIFTFMGSSVLRQDDAYSIQIISKTIETIVPIVNAVNDEKHACEILRIFVVSLPDIPEHRRIPLFVKLLQLLDNNLHLFYLLTFESHVLSSQQTKESSSGQTIGSSRRLEFALDISQQFSPQKIIQVCVKLVKFVKSLPVEIDDDNKRELRNFSGKHIFDVANNSPKQLRHYKYTVVQFLSAVLSSPEFVNKVAILGDDDTEKIQIFYDRLIVELVTLIETASKSADVNQGKPKGKYWKVLLHNLYDILDAVNALLPNKIFIASIKRLVAHDLLTVRKKALELLNSRLHQKRFTDDDHERLLEFVESLVEIVSKHGKMLSTELEIIQQTALITIKLLARLLATENPAYFKPILDLSTELVKTKEGPMLASAVLCVAELCSSMRTHAIQSLNKFAPAIIRLLKTHCHQESPDIVVISIVSALQKIVESVGNFLSLYLDQLLSELTSLSALYTDAEHPKIGLVVSRLKATTQKLASCIPMRVLLPAIGKTYGVLLGTSCYQCVSPLMNILAESFNHVSSKDLQAAIPDLATFFLRVLQFREDITIIGDSNMEIDDECKTATMKDVVSVEESASRAVVALVLKLSEATFRPLYYKLYDWAARNPEHKQRNITFYRLSANIAERLKSLFVLFAGHFLKHAASLLSANNPIVTEQPTELTLPEQSNRIELVEAILLTFYRVFSYDAHNFVNQERFDTLAQPIVDQIENTMGTTEDYEKRAKELIIPCVAAFASATQDDSLHKQLVYQTLLKTRHTKPNVRSAALSALVEIARKLGEDFMPLLAETVPFLAELLEDEDEGTEKSAQNAVRTLEDILGEPLQKYF